MLLRKISLFSLFFLSYICLGVTNDELDFNATIRAQMEKFIKLKSILSEYELELQKNIASLLANNGSKIEFEKAINETFTKLLEDSNFRSEQCVPLATTTTTTTTTTTPAPTTTPTTTETPIAKCETIGKGICVKRWDCENTKQNNKYFINLNEHNECHYLETCCNVTSIRNISLPLSTDRTWPRCGDTNPQGVYMSIVSDKPSYTNFGEFSWVVAIYRRSNIFLTIGSLIAPHIVLNSMKALYRVRALKVRAGDWDIETSNEILPYQEIEVQRIVDNSFNSLTHGNDIALLILKSKFNPAPHIGRVCLPIDGPLDLTNCRAVGWNVDTAYGPKIMTMMKVNLTKCANGIDDTLFCAKGIQRTLKYAAGSPLVCPKLNASPNRYYQIGIWSHGDGPRTNIMFTNVTKLITWIQENMEN